MNRFAGTATLIKAAALRDRLMIGVTLVLLAAVVAASDRTTRGLYPHGLDVSGGLLATMRNGAFVAIYGPVPQPVSVDAVGISKVLLLGGVGLAVLAQVIVRRHTRADEESGLGELTGAQVVGRRAPLSAAIAVAGASVLGGAVLAGVGLVLVGAPAAGAVDFGICWVVIGLIGAALAAVCVQVAASSRGAGQLGLIGLGVLYLIRMVGDAGGSALSWVSPLGWASKSSPFGGDHYWILLPGLVVSALLVVTAYRLLDRRDLGAGLLPQHHGPARGRLRGNGALVWRLLRGTVLGWLASFAVLGCVVGSLIRTLGGSSDPAIRTMLRTLGGGHGSLADLYLATEISICALIATAAGLMVTTHLAAEERAGRLDALLAAPVPRGLLVAPYLCAALGLPAVLMLVFTAGIGAAAHLTGSGSDVSPAALLRSAAATCPAMWTVVALGMLLFGMRLAWASGGWAVLVLAGAVAQFGGVFGLPQWVRGWSPFDHLAGFPADRIDMGPTVALSLIAAAITAAGVGAFRRRRIG